MNQELGAQAFTHGSDVYFGQGKEPGNNELTAHELTHVVQQTGAVQTKLNFQQIEPLVQRLTTEDKKLNLKSQRFAGNPRLEATYDNSPAMRKGEQGDAVKLVQQGLIDDGLAMPISTRKTGEPDGIFGDETDKTVWQFQEKHQLGKDGVVGRNTLGKLDELSTDSTTNPEQQTGETQTQPSTLKKIWYMLSVPPAVIQIGNTCWAAALSSWLSAMNLDSQTVFQIVWRYTGTACIHEDNSLYETTLKEVFAEWGVHFTRYSTHGSVTYNQLKSLLKRHGHLIMAEASDNIGHALVVYGVGIDNNQQPNPNYFSVMDPIDGQYKNLPLSGLNYPVRIGFLGNRERPAPCRNQENPNLGQEN
jgi:peptidoglycan hydrolase-like protein with peptidoglycan-binding domain